MNLAFFGGGGVIMWSGTRGLGKRNNNLFYEIIQTAVAER